MRKAYWRILPLICVAYLLAWVDRVNVSFASIQMNVDLKFSATIYGLGGGLFFFSYALIAVPSNLFLVRFGARSWLGRIMIAWGLLAAGMMCVRTPTQFYAMRFLLGAAEGGFFPGVIYYFADWFPTAFRGRAVSRFFVAGPLASVVMGGVSGWLLGLDGLANLRGWQWLFLVEGLPSVVAGLLVLRYLPNAPGTAAWLSAPEKAWIKQNLTTEAARIGAPIDNQPFSAFFQPRTLQLGVISFLMLGSTVTLILSAPAVLKTGTGLDTQHIGYLVSAGGIVGALCMLLAGWYSDHKGDRLLMACACMAVVSLSLVVLASSSSFIIVQAAYLAFGAVCFTVVMLTASSWADVLHVRHLAMGAAAINTLGNIGAFFMPYWWGVIKDETGNYQAGLMGLSVVALATAALILKLRRGLHRA
jgi:ACS family tartrate transporter-like MFS transporter